jgi:hypothetical protein
VWWSDGWAKATNPAHRSDAATIDAPIDELDLESLGWCAWLSGDPAAGVALEEVQLLYSEDSGG